MASFYLSWWIFVSLSCRLWYSLYTVLWKLFFYTKKDATLDIHYRCRRIFAQLSMDDFTNVNLEVIGSEHIYGPKSRVPMVNLYPLIQVLKITWTGNSGFKLEYFNLKKVMPKSKMNVKLVEVKLGFTWCNPPCILKFWKNKMYLFTPGNISEFQWVK